MTLKLFNSDDSPDSSPFPSLYFLISTLSKIFIVPYYMLHHHLTITLKRYIKNVTPLSLLSLPSACCLHPPKIGRDDMCPFNTFHPLHGQSIHHGDIIEKRTGWNMLRILLSGFSGMISYFEYGQG